jgi:hypothetical protein
MILIWLYCSQEVEQSRLKQVMRFITKKNTHFLQSWNKMPAFETVLLDYTKAV